MLRNWSSPKSSRRITIEQLVNALFGLIRPFMGMMRDLLDYFQSFGKNQKRYPHFVQVYRSISEGWSTPVFKTVVRSRNVSLSQTGQDILRPKASTSSDPSSRTRSSKFVRHIAAGSTLPGED